MKKRRCPIPNFNSVVLIGHLTRDPELRYTPTNVAVCEFSIAVNRRWTSKDGEAKEEVSFFDCVAWQRTAEVVAEHMRKGRAILVSGFLKQERWEDQNGGKRSRVRVQAQNVQFLGSPAKGEPEEARADEVTDAEF